MIRPCTCIKIHINIEIRTIITPVLLEFSQEEGDGEKSIIFSTIFFFFFSNKVFVEEYIIGAF